ncbi:hypothetical protein GE09DRAFT_1141560 [Coniochaeta sp. 2T2.1]|nr:hypothetical protein GE09DRAFT_1141560 [Coniochaeta sp. 2T2.1]
MESTILDQQDPATDDLNTKRFLAQPKSAMEPQMIPYKVISKRRLESVLDKKFPKGDYHVSVRRDVYHIEAPSHLTKVNHGPQPRSVHCGRRH